MRVESTVAVITEPVGFASASTSVEGLARREPKSKKAEGLNTVGNARRYGRPYCHCYWHIGCLAVIDNPHLIAQMRVEVVAPPRGIEPRFED